MSLGSLVGGDAADPDQDMNRTRQPHSFGGLAGVQGAAVAGASNGSKGERFAFIQTQQVHFPAGPTVRRRLIYEQSTLCC